MRAILTALILLGWSIATARSQPAPPDDQELAEKKYAVSLEGAKWADAFDWYSKITGLKAQDLANPEGTLTLKTESDRRLTSAEITDLLNKSLMEQQLLLIPTQATFTVVSGKRKIDPKLIRAVDLSDLPKLPRTALVEVNVPVTLAADEKLAEIVVEVKKLLSPFGEMRSANGTSLVVRDIVENVVRIRVTLAPL